MRGMRLVLVNGSDEGGGSERDEGGGNGGSGRRNKNDGRSERDKGCFRGR